MLQLSPAQLIDRYGLFLDYDANGYTGRVLVSNRDLCIADDALPAIKAAKPEIYAILIGQVAATLEETRQRDSKIAAIPGLQEIRDAQADLARWKREWDASFEGEGGGGVGVRKRPEYDLAAMCKAYPLAAAYLEAEEFSHSYNDVKSSAGSAALEALLDGADPAETMKTMRDKWSTYANVHAWD